MIYEAERRDRPRRALAGAGSAPRRVRLAAKGRAPLEAEVADTSPDGLGLRVPADLAPGTELRVTFLDGPARGRERFAEVRNTRPGPSGWRRVGVSLLPAFPGPSPPVERRDRIYVGAAAAAVPPPARARANGTAVAPSPPPAVRVVDYPASPGESIRAIVDTVGDPRGAAAIVIPPAWGKTKETLLPLAATLEATFARAGQPLVVLRFDGVRRRGESHNDPDCRAPGCENLHYTFSQGARDILATLDFLERAPGYRPATTVLVTFSAASIEGRRALASDLRGRIGGWISVVGASDPQHLVRSVSGGLDYLGGVERGLRFGCRDVQGLLLDIDRAGADAIESRIAFLEDARRDLCGIDVPITWIHGRHDAWMDLERIRGALRFGDGSKRRLIEVPTGHQLRSSREALETFQLIAVEAARMALGVELEAVTPDPARLRARRRAERARLSRAPADVRSFWRDYLVGRGRDVGMELVTGTKAYRELMDAQIEALALCGGERVLDLGSGVGTFPAALAAAARGPAEVVEVDYVVEGLRRARERLANGARPPGVAVRFAVADLNLDGGRCGVPIARESADAVLASLLLNYVAEPEALLREIRALLRPGGRLVLSSLRRDADTSRICADGVAELRAGAGRALLGSEGERALGDSLRGFINDAARLLDLEERGFFRFWDAPEVADMLERAGFAGVSARAAFGDPPQAVLASARRPA